MKTFQQFSAELVISEEDYDRMKDSRMERGGIDGNTRYPLKSSGGGGKKVSDDETRARQKKVMDMVRASVTAKHGAGALLSNKKNESYVPGKPAEKLGAVTAIPKDERQAALERIKAKTAEMRKKKGLPEEFELEEGMSLKDYKKKRSAVKQKEKRAADKIAPNRRKDIHTDKYSPERAARHRANVDPDFEGNDERNYPGGKLNPKKVRKAKALGELGEAVYGGKKEEPKDTRYTVTAADKKGNTAAYQKYKAGDKRYKAAPHLGEEVLDEKALSKQQQKFMGMVYAVKKGEMKAPSPEVAKAAAGMSKKSARDFAKTKHKGLPQVKEGVLNEREHDEPGEGPRQKYGDMRGLDRGTGNEVKFGGKWQSKARKEAGAAALAKLKSGIREMEEPMEPAKDKASEMQKKNIQMQKVRELTTRLRAARKGVY